MCVCVCMCVYVCVCVCAAAAPHITTTSSSHHDHPTTSSLHYHNTSSLHHDHATTTAPLRCHIITTTSSPHHHCCCCCGGQAEAEAKKERADMGKHLRHCLSMKAGGTAMEGGDEQPEPKATGARTKQGKVQVKAAAGRGKMRRGRAPVRLEEAKPPSPHWPAYGRCGQGSSLTMSAWSGAETEAADTWRLRPCIIISQ